jgi:hypothetical protein
LIPNFNILAKGFYIMTLGLFSLYCHQSYALVKIGSSIVISDHANSWHSEYKSIVDHMKANGTYPADNYTECRPVSEISQVYLCQFNTILGMSNALNRATAFVEGVGGTKGHVMSQTEYRSSLSHTIIVGHDLQGKDLLRYSAEATKACHPRVSEDFCARKVEKDFFENFVKPMIAIHPDFVVIAFANQDSGWKDILSHEILHAQYFNVQTYRDTVDGFWHGLTTSQKNEIVERLSILYDTSSEYLMRNEFQAYLLQAGAESWMFADLLDLYRKPLIKMLESNGHSPIQIK